MKPEIKAAWIAALRSGEYKQGRQRLRRTGVGHCCLGVICDVYSKLTGGAGQWEEPDANWGERFTFGRDSDAVFPTEKLLAVLGLKKEDASTLYKMNDGIVNTPRSFAEIADWIEKNVEES